MKNIFDKTKKVFAFLTTCLLSISFVACSETDFNGLADVWSAENTVRVMKDETFTEKGEDSFSISLAKNETEGAQIIFTAKENLTFQAELVGDLVDNVGNQIFMENVRLYAFHYIETTLPSANYPTGYYPDAIVPMEKYVARGDNKVKKGDNQGIYLEVTTNEYTSAGSYTGKVKLTLNGQSSYIPVYVSVYDFALPKETHSWTAFNIWTGSIQDMLFAGEYDNSEAMFEKYYEFLLDYRVASTYLPTHDYMDVAKYVEVVKEYAVREDVPCYSLPYVPLYKEEYSNWVFNPDEFKALMKALVLASTDELDLLKKAYIYVSNIDEPHSTMDFERVKFVDSNIQRVIKELVQEFDAQGYFEDKGTLRDSLLNFRHVVTTEYDADMVEYVDTFCPTWDKYGDAMYNYEASLRVAEGKTQWWYSCNIPLNPYPTYHIDDNLLGSRVVNWMQKKYDIEGNLYWAVNIYKKSYNGVYGYRDIWNDPLAFPPYGSIPGSNGDGFLLYPGERYGIDGPIATIRLATIRDGLEDYEYLYLLEELICEYNAKYGTNFTLDEIVGFIYDRLFTGMMYNTDAQTFQQAREEVANLIIALQEGQTLINISGINAEKGLATIEIYTSADNTVFVNGEQLLNGTETGDGVKYVRAVSVAETENFVNIRILGKDGDFECKRFIANRVKSISSFNDGIENASASKFSSEEDTLLSLNTLPQYIQEGKGSLKTTLIPKGTGMYIRSMDMRFASMENMQKCKSISLSVYNDSETPVQLYVRLVDKNNKVKEIGNFVAVPKEWTKITISVNDFGALDASSMKALRILFPEITPTSAYNESFDMYFDNVYFEEGRV